MTNEELDIEKWFSRGEDLLMSYSRTNVSDSIGKLG